MFRVEEPARAKPPCVASSAGYPLMSGRLANLAEFSKTPSSLPHTKDGLENSREHGRDFACYPTWVGSTALRLGPGISIAVSRR